MEITSHVQPSITLQNEKLKARLLQLLPFLLIISGIVLRVFHFLYNRGLWGDEALLALNLINKSFAQLAHPPLDYEQYAPLGFLWAERFFIALFGNSERALRLFPLLCGVASLFAGYRLGLYILSPFMANVFLAFIAFSSPAIYYSVETKQYQTEFLVTLLLLCSYFYYRDKVTYLNMLIWGAIGAVTCWFSYPSIFFLFSIGLVVFIANLWDRNWQRIAQLTVAFGMWGISFIVNYFLFISLGTKSNYLNEYWQENFMPLSGGVGKLTLWAITTYNQLMDNPFGLIFAIQELIWVMPVVSFIAFVLGVFFLFRNDKVTGCVLLLPLLLVLVASALEKYPVYQRFILFYTPAFYLIIVYGTERTANLLKHSSVWKAVAAFGFVFILAFNSLYRVAKPKSLYNQIDIREAALYIKDHIQEGDGLFVYLESIPPFAYYNQLYNLQLNNLYLPQEDYTAADTLQLKRQLVKALSPLKKNKRAWLVLRPRINITLYTERGKLLIDKEQKELILDAMQDFGHLMDHKSLTRTDIYIYRID